MSETALHILVPLLVLAGTALQCWLCLPAFYRLTRYKLPRPCAPYPPVSIIVASHNNLPGLQTLLPLLLTQDYPAFEVLVIDDRSSDQTPAWLADLAVSHNGKLRVHRIEQTPEGYAPKKFAIASAIRQARYEWLLFTDSDCMPASGQWLSCMAAQMYGPSAIILGYGPYQRRPGLLNWFIRMETFWSGSLYLGAALSGWPFMAVGRNLAYHKKVFEVAGGFQAHRHVLSGDDDLLLHAAVAKQVPVRICVAPEAIVFSEPKTTWKSWFRQKKRHMHAGLYYPMHQRIRLGLLSVAQVLIYLPLLVLPFSSSTPVILIGTGFLHLIRLVVLIRFLRLISCLLDEKLIIFLLPLFEVLHLAYILITGVATLTSKKIRWN